MNQSSYFDGEEGIEKDIRSLGDAGRRLRRVGWLILVIFGPPSLFLFAGLMIAMALQQPVAPRAVIVFPVLAFVVFGTGVSYVILARSVARGSRLGVIASLSIAVTVTLVGLFDFWSGLLGWDGQSWIVFARMVISFINLMLMKPLFRCLGASQRLQTWMDSDSAAAGK
jgi:hypothetical protein